MNLTRIHQEMTKTHADHLERLVRIETSVMLMKQTLLGNGQPGLVQKFDEELEQLTTRLTSLEGSRSKVTGILSALSFVLTFVSWSYLKKFFVDE